MNLVDQGTYDSIEFPREDTMRYTRLKEVFDEAARLASETKNVLKSFISF